MRLFLLTALTMIAFAANSVLNRLAVGAGHMDAESFAIVRLGAGMGMLVILAIAQKAPLRQPVGRLVLGGGSLTLYMLGFSLAYRTLDAGLGALILFGVVQFTMIAWNAVTGARLNGMQWAGAGGALLGLAVVLWPDDSGPVPLDGLVFMALAGLGWGAYSLVGKAALNPLGATAGNFTLSFGLTLVGLIGLGWEGHMSALGILWAVLSGAVTSGMGYALWYAVLPRLPGAVAATVQLSVPVIALMAGAVMLGEQLDLRVSIGAAIVIGGIAAVLRGGNPGKSG